MPVPPPPWRTPRIETGPIVLGTRRLYVLPTRLGLLYAALLGGLFIGSLNYGINLGYLFTFLLVGVGTVSLIHTQRNLAGLVLGAGPVRPVHAGEPAVFPLRLDNPHRRPRFDLVLRGPGDASPPLDLAGQDSGELRLALPQPRRGFHRPGRLVLASTWPLGLFRCWTVFQLDWGALVYPRPAADSLPLPAAAGEGSRAGVARAEEAEFAGLRDYHPGDPLRSIAWKAVARGQGLLSKTFAGERTGQVWLDWEATPERETEARLSRLTRWALDAESSGLTWGLSLPGRRLSSGRGETHLRQALEYLARHGTRTEAT